MQALETGTSVARENKKILRDYFIQMGVKPKKVKGVMRAMGFVHPHLGN